MRLRDRARQSTPPPGDDPSPIGEADLITCAVTDPRAFAELYLRYVAAVHHYCYRRLGSIEAAEDATSLVFERVLKALPGYRGGVFRAWLFTIAHNVITDSYRSAREHHPIDAARELADPSPQPDRLVLLADDQRLLLAALSALPPEQRRVMELRLGGLPSTDVAVVLDRSPESVRALQFRAIKRLRDLLRDPADPAEVRHA